MTVQLPPPFPAESRGIHQPMARCAIGQTPSACGSYPVGVQCLSLRAYLSGGSRVIDAGGPHADRRSHVPSPLDVSIVRNRRGHRARAGRRVPLHPARSRRDHRGGRRHVQRTPGRPGGHCRRGRRAGARCPATRLPRGQRRPEHRPCRHQTADAVRGRLRADHRPGRGPARQRLLRRTLRAQRVQGRGRQRRGRDHLEVRRPQRPDQHLALAQRAGQRHGVRRRGQPGDRRVGRQRRPAGDQDRHAHRSERDPGRLLRGQEAQRPERGQHRRAGPDLLHRPALRGARAGRATGPGRVPDRHRRVGPPHHRQRHQAERRVRRAGSKHPVRGRFRHRLPRRATALPRRNSRRSRRCR